MNSKYIKTVSTIVLSTLIILSILPATLFIPIAKAQGTITLSSSNLHPYKVIEIRVDIPGLTADNITLRVLDPTGQPIQLKNLQGNTITTFVAVKVATGVYYAYLGGNMTDMSKIPKYPKVSRTATDAFVNITQKLTPTTLTIEVLGYGITATVKYNVVASSISLDRTSLPVRRPREFKVTLTLSDQDLNFDPTAVDVFTGSNATFIALWLTHINGTTGVSTPEERPADLSQFTIKETAVNSGSFTLTFTVYNLTQWLGITAGRLSKDDTVIFKAASNITISGTAFGNDNDLYDTKIAKAVYTYPTISIDFTQQKLVITINSPDDNVNPAAIDTLDPQKSVTLWYAGIPYNIKSCFSETDKNTGVFVCSLAVIWNTSRRVDTANWRIGLDVDRASFSVSVEYLDVSALGSYTPVKPVIEVVKATPKVVLFRITDKDLNTDPKSVQYLSPSISGNVIRFNVSTPGGWVTLYEVAIKDSNGNPVTLPPAYSPSFFETDLDSSVFNLMLPSAGVFTAGNTYIIDITDHTGARTTITQIITITPIKIELDRAKYPVNATTPVVVYITYYNDTANYDPTTKQTIPPRLLNYTVTAVNGATIASGTVSNLEETGPDTGVFEGYITLSTTSPAWINAKLTVFVTSKPDVKAEATFEPYGLTPTDLTVSPAEVNITGCFKVTVYDPDSNVDSQTKQVIYVNITGSKGTTSLKLVETDVNTGVFTGTFCNIPSIAKPGDKITVLYREKTPVLAPTARDFASAEYTITASVKVVSFSGYLVVPKDWIGPYEVMTIKLVDPDLNVDPTKADTASVTVLVEGMPSPTTITLTETNISTGVFAGKINLPVILTGRQTPDPKDVAPFIGKKVTIVYVDEADATGSRATVVQTLTIKAVDAVIEVDKPTVNVGETLKITIKNADIAQNPAPEFRKVLIRSTTYPTGITLYALEVEPGVYEVTVRVVSLAEWTIGAPQIPAKLGDTITIEYSDPIAADGTAWKLFSKSVAVGRFVEMPGKAEAVKTVDVTTGAEVKPSVGKEVFLTLTIRNTDIVERSMTVIVVVRDPAGVAVARYAAAVTLGAGAATDVSFGWTPIVSGGHSVEVYIVKSLADRTPVGAPATFTVSVGS